MFTQELGQVEVLHHESITFLWCVAMFVKEDGEKTCCAGWYLRTRLGTDACLTSFVFDEKARNAVACGPMCKSTASVPHLCPFTPLLSSPALVLCSLMGVSAACSLSEGEERPDAVVLVKVVTSAPPPSQQVTGVPSASSSWPSSRVQRPALGFFHR